MKRGKPLKRTELKRGDSQLERRARVNPKSDKRKVQDREEAKVKRDVLARDGGCVMRHLQGRPYGKLTIPFCAGALEKDEIVSRARGGSAVDRENTQILCSLHNRWKEDHPHAALALGVARHSWDR